MTTPDPDLRAPDALEAHDDPFAALGEPVGLSGRRTEALIATVLALVAVAVTAYMARDLWFTTDEWEFLAGRTAFDLGDLTRPTGGHWTTWSVLLLRGLYNLFGVDFWPWYYVPRLVGHTLLVVLVWQALRRRGADPLVAMVGFAVLLVLGASGYQRALQVGNWAVYAALVVCAVVIARRPDAPTVRDRVIVAVALMVGVLGNGYSVAVIAGIVGALILVRSIVVWIPSLVPAVAAYGIWWLSYRDDIRPKPTLTVGKLLDIPEGAFRVLRSSVESATALPGWAAAVVVVGLLAWIGLLALRRRLDLFDSIVLLTLLVGLALLNIQRISIDPDAANRLRYGYSVAILLALALLPHVRLPRTILARVGLVVVGVVLVAANTVQMRDAINVREQDSRQARDLAEASALMLADGEPYVAGTEIYSGLEVEELLQLVDDGYRPDPLPEDRVDRDEVLADARGNLRMSALVLNRPRAEGFDPDAGTPPTVEVAVDADGCILLAEGEPVSATVTDEASLTTVKLPPQVLVLTWVDDHGEGFRRIDDPDVRRIGVELARPDGTAELTLESGVGDLRVCGFAPT